MAAIQTTTTPVLPVPQPMPDEVVLAHGKADAAYTPAMAIQIALVLAICLVTLPLAPFAYAFASRTLRMHAWWVTNQRIVVRTGFIGWTLRSIPLDRIVDISATSSWYDRIFGVTHLKIRDMTGESTGDGVSRGVHLMAVPNAREIERLILERVPARSTQDDMGQVVNLLQQLVDRAA